MVTFLHLFPKFCDKIVNAYSSSTMARNLNLISSDSQFLWQTLFSGPIPVEHFCLPWLWKSKPCISTKYFRKKTHLSYFLISHPAKMLPQTHFQRTYYWLIYLLIINRAAPQRSGLWAVQNTTLPYHHFSFPKILFFLLQHNFLSYFAWLIACVVESAQKCNRRPIPFIGKFGI